MAQNTSQNCLRHIGSVMVILYFAIKFTIESLIFKCGILIVYSGTVLHRQKSCKGKPWIFC